MPSAVDDKIDLSSRGDLAVEPRADGSKTDLTSGSALDVVDATYAGSNASLSLPPSKFTSDRIRRRSDIARFRAPESMTTAAILEAQGIELPVLPAIREHAPHASGTGLFAEALGGAERRIGDLENPSENQNSDAPSVRAAATPAPTVSEAERRAFRMKGRIHFAALCYCFFLEGWNDGTTGPLLPAIQDHYHIGYSIVSLLFVFNCIGFIGGAFLNVYINDRLGFGKVLVLGSISQLLAYAMLAPAGPFPLMCTAFMFAGFGIAMQNAQANGFVGGLREHVSVKFGFLHASYGLGAFVAPLVATQFAGTRHWSYHYIISAAIAVTNSLVLAYVFRLRTQEETMAEAGQTTTGEGEGAGVAQNRYKEVLGLRAVHYLSAFALIYVGVEVTLGGWIVTFIEQKRGGGASAGYISSGFFGGLMLGRITLMWLNERLGARRAIFVYAFIVILLEITIWFTPSLYENAVAISVVGLLLGPMYPLLMRHCTRVLPPSASLLTACVGYVAGVGQAGSAVVPVVMGAVASRWGIGALQPFIVSMMSTMVVVWVFVPRVRRVD